MVINVEEVYLHCTKALVRSELWNADKQVDRSALPSTGTMYRDQLALDKVPPEVIDQALDESERNDIY